MFDPWLSESTLANSIHSSLVINSGLGLLATVSLIINNSSWSLPSSNHQDIIEFRERFDFNRHCVSTALD